MESAKGKSLDRKKLLADPVLVMAILLIMAFLLLFIVYPLWTVTAQSFSRGEADMIAAVKDSGEWFSQQAARVEDGSMQEFADLGQKISKFGLFLPVFSISSDFFCTEAAIFRHSA